MEPHIRSRSSSANGLGSLHPHQPQKQQQQHHYLKHANSSSSFHHQPLDSDNPALSLPDLPTDLALAQTFVDSGFDPSQSFAQSSLAQSYNNFQEQASLQQQYHMLQQQQQQQQGQQQQQQQLNQHRQSFQQSQHNHSAVPHSLEASNAYLQTQSLGAQEFPPLEYNPAFDDPILDNFNSQALGLLQPNTMATTMHTHSPHNHFSDANNINLRSGSPSPSASPRFQNASNDNRPRNSSESLDPSSAMYAHEHSEWASLPRYQTHNRNPSDNLSDVSSNHASPYLSTLGNSSPFLGPSGDGSFNGNTLQGFHLDDHSPQSFYTPAPTPGHSPLMMPQPVHDIPLLNGNEPGIHMNGNGDSQHSSNDPMPMFLSISDPFPELDDSSISPRELSKADHLTPPQINIDYAPTEATSAMTTSNQSSGALSPPLPGTRTRSTSAPLRPRSASPSMRPRSPSLQAQALGNDSLSPFASGDERASTSPQRGRKGSTGSGGPIRSQSHSHSRSTRPESRGKILDLADGTRPHSWSQDPSAGSNGGRPGQKHPATFQCHLCPKRFTRAYNLRSHLRTHTDERPFVCTVCSKAFARQHDRKRHEDLHTGEKKFVCRGTLQSGLVWGCNRRFARADALGRHFRSEAGRVCIKPLLEEEANERQRRFLEQQQQQMHQSQQHDLVAAQQQQAAALQQQQQRQAMTPQDLWQQQQQDLFNNPSFLPAALLAQYPALAQIDWDALAAANGNSGVPGSDVPGGTFDASDYDHSGTEYYDADDASDLEVPQMGTRDYMSDFEGR